MLFGVSCSLTLFEATNKVVGFYDRVNQNKTQGTVLCLCIADKGKVKVAPSKTKKQHSNFNKCDLNFIC